MLMIALCAANCTAARTATQSSEQQASSAAAHAEQREQATRAEAVEMRIEGAAHEVVEVERVEWSAPDSVGQQHPVRTVRTVRRAQRMVAAAAERVSLDTSSTVRVSDSTAAYRHDRHDHAEQRPAQRFPRLAQWLAAGAFAGALGALIWRSKR